MAPDLGDEADIISLDLKQPGSELIELLDSLDNLLNKPIFISSFAFGAEDRGCLSNGVSAVSSQDDRGDAYESLVHHAAAHPNIIGIQYRQYLDDPCLGDPLGRCAQVGLVDVCHQAYAEMTNLVAVANAAAYSIRTGQMQPKEAPISFIPIKRLLILNSTVALHLLRCFE